MNASQFRGTLALSVAVALGLAPYGAAAEFVAGSLDAGIESSESAASGAATAPSEPSEAFFASPTLETREVAAPGPMVVAPALSVIPIAPTLTINRKSPVLTVPKPRTMAVVDQRFSRLSAAVKKRVGGLGRRLFDNGYEGASAAGAPVGRAYGSPRIRLLPASAGSSSLHTAIVPLAAVGTAGAGHAHYFWALAALVVAMAANYFRNPGANAFSPPQTSNGGHALQGKTVVLADEARAALKDLRRNQIAHKRAQNAIKMLEQAGPGYPSLHTRPAVQATAYVRRLPAAPPNGESMFVSAAGDFNIGPLLFWYLDKNSQDRLILVAIEMIK